MSIDAALLERLWFSDLTYDQMAARLGCSNYAIYWHAKKMNLPKRTKRRSDRQGLSFPELRSMEARKRREPEVLSERTQRLLRMFS